jgi:hypothetical protein
VVFLSHYPMVSFREKAESAGVYYGDNDLENLEEVARQLLDRAAPTVVVNGHMYMRDDCAAEKVLKISCATLTQPPFDVTLLDLATGGGRISVGVERISVAPSPNDVRLSALSPRDYDGFSRKGRGVRRRRSRRSSQRRGKGKEQRASLAPSQLARSTSSDRSQQVPSSYRPRAAW